MVSLWRIMGNSLVEGPLLDLQMRHQDLNLLIQMAKRQNFRLLAHSKA